MREVLFESRDGLAVITLNRPAKLNSLTVEMFQELLVHIERIEKSPEEFGCILLRGAGRCFSAGHDLGQIDEGESLPSPNFQPLLVERLANIPPPLVVAVHSHCYTGALELAWRATSYWPRKTPNSAIPMGSGACPRSGA